MRWALLVLAALAATAAEPAFTIELREITYSQRVEYILGDGERPFADEDQRRAQLVLGVKATGKTALLGWGELAVTEAVSDRDEALAIAVGQPEGVFATTHELQADPVLALPGVPLPLTRQACAGLKRFVGSVEVRYATEAATALRIPIADLAPNAEHALPGIDGGTLTLAEKPGGDGRVQARLNPAAYLAVQDLAFFDAKGVELPTRNRRSEWRDNQGQLTLFAKAQPATVEVRFYAKVLRQRLAFSLPALNLGLSLPGREDLRGQTRTGANGF